MKLQRHLKKRAGHFGLKKHPRALQGVWRGSGGILVSVGVWGGG